MFLKKNLISKELGRIGEAEFEKFCFAHKIQVSKACVEAYPYDYIIDIKGKLYKVQVKTTMKYDGEKYHFSIRKTSLVHSKWTSLNYSASDVDFYFLYCPKTERSFLMKFRNSGDIVIREKQCKQKAKINYADDFDAEKILEKLLNR